jgi:hypothetical protein
VDGIALSVGTSVGASLFVGFVGGGVAALILVGSIDFPTTVVGCGVVLDILLGGTVVPETGVGRGVVVAMMDGCRVRALASGTCVPRPVGDSVTGILDAGLLETGATDGSLTNGISEGYNRTTGSNDGTMLSTTSVVG